MRGIGFSALARKSLRHHKLKILQANPYMSDHPSAMKETVQMRDGDCILVMVKDGKVIHWTWNMGLPHVEFVRRATGTRPEGAWVGTVSKLDGEVMGITSKYFYDYQLPAPPDVNAVIKELFK
jgi:hypothetical protein